MKWLLDHAIVPKVIFNGSKIMSLKIHAKYRIKFRDSLNFVPMSLAKWAASCALQEQKTHFPHDMNGPDYWGREIPFPDRHHYGYDTMSRAERRTFLKFYRKERRRCRNVFDVNRTLAEYCNQDTKTLRVCYQQFRELFFELSDGICPFSCAVTLPGMQNIFDQILNISD